VLYCIGEGLKVFWHTAWNIYSQCSAIHSCKSIDTTLSVVDN